MDKLRRAAAGRRAALTYRLCVFLLLAVFSTLILFPPLWALSTSLKPEKEILRYPPTILPTRWYLGNYRALFIAMPFARSLLNSFIVSSLSVCLTISAHGNSLARAKAAPPMATKSAPNARSRAASRDPSS